MASGGIGSTGHVSGELFKMMAAVKLVHVPYRGGGPALADLIAGQVIEAACFPRKAHSADVSARGCFPQPGLGSIWEAPGRPRVGDEITRPRASHGRGSTPPSHSNSGLSAMNSLSASASSTAGPAVDS